MTGKDNSQTSDAPNAAAATAAAAADALKGWTMTALTFVFVLLYAAALVGWLKPLTDAGAAARLEPIIFVIVGYYFGRLPAQQNEKLLKEEIARQTQKADAAQHVKERIGQERERLEERVKNARISLAAHHNPRTHDKFGESGAPGKDEIVGNLRGALASAIGILSS